MTRFTDAPDHAARGSGEISGRRAHIDGVRNRRLTQDGVAEDLQRQPYLLMRLAENALMVADGFRDNYLRQTARFVSHLRRAIHEARVGDREDPVIDIGEVTPLSWSDLGGEVVTFIDGGVGRVQIASKVPILLRVGSYCVRTGERRLAEREQFGYYPVVLGDLEGGSHDRKDFVDVVRITAELLGGLSALERTPDLRLLMFHGPLVYTVGHYAGHAPFTEADVDLFLRHYAPDPATGRALKEEFLREAALDIYPAMVGHPRWAERRLFEPLAFMAYLCRRMIRLASVRTPRPIIVGVVERGAELREFAEDHLLRRVFRGMQERGTANYFNEMFGRTDLTSPRALLERLSYTDTLLLAMVLDPGQYTEAWTMDKYQGLNRAEVSVPGQEDRPTANYGALRPGRPGGFPAVCGTYLRVGPNTDPLRVEMFADLGPEQQSGALDRVYLYARLLPGYGFPVGLDVADKFAKVPSWLTDAYAKMIRHRLGVSLQRGEVRDAEMRRLLVQAMYMTHRDFLFRPTP